MISVALGPRVIQSHLVPGPGVISAGDGGQEWESRQERRLGVGSRLVGLHREGLLSGTPLLSRNCLALGGAVPQGQQAPPPSKHQIQKIERNAVYNIAFPFHPWHCNSPVLSLITCHISTELAGPITHP